MSEHVWGKMKRNRCLSGNPVDHVANGLIRQAPSAVINKKEAGVLNLL